MKKLVKMSLVAAVAVAGLTNVNAASLEESIKGVKISGFISYTMEKVSNDTATADKEAQHDIDLRIQAVIPVNDMLSATIRIDESNDDDNDKDKQGLTGTNSSSVELDVDRAYFTYKNDGFTSNFGLIQAPLTDAAQADGINFTKDFGSFALGAGYLYTTGVSSDEVAFATIAGAAGPVNYSLAYASLIDSDASDTNGSLTDNKANFLHASVSTKIDVISIGLDYSQKTGLAGALKDNSQYKISLGADLGMFSLGLAYAANDKDGGNTLIDGTDVAASNITVAGMELQSYTDASAIQADASVKIGSASTLSLTYATLDTDTVGEYDRDAIVVNYNYAMSKNFKVYANYEINDVDGMSNDMTELTLGAKYSF